MAAADYRLCDVCDGKAFYDSNLNYEQGPDGWNTHQAPYRIAGHEQYGSTALVDKYGTRLDSLGDWAVLCTDCAKTHRTQIVPIEGDGE